MILFRKGVYMNNLLVLSECEEMIMTVLWSSEEDLDLATVTDQMQKRYKKTWKLQTVATFMTRLEKKKYIDIYRIGRYSHYRPKVKLESYRLWKLEEVGNLLFDGDWNVLRDVVNALK